MQKLITLTLAILLVFSLAACGGNTTPETTKVISPEEYSALYDKYLTSIDIGMIFNSEWDDANNIEPDYFLYYYAHSFVKSGGKFEVDEDYGMYIPADELEAYVQSHFDVTTEHLRTNEYYIEERNAYEFGGLGSAWHCEITGAGQKGNLLTIEYDVIGPMDYAIGRGVLTIETNGENYKYLSNEFGDTAQGHLDYPNSMGIIDNKGILMMDSGGGITSGNPELNIHEYRGSRLSDIIYYYENVALPALKAVGEADTSKYADGWYWTGTYHNSKPLTIDIQRRFGADTYIITALYDEKVNPNVADYMRRQDFMQPPNMSNFSELFSIYLWKPYYAGVLDYTWSMAENADVPSLVRLYARDADYTGESFGEGTTFPADDVESYIQRYFDISTDIMRGWNVYDRDKNAYNYTPAENPAVCSIVSATTYGSEDGSPATIVLAYEVMRSEEDNTVIWSGELTIELSESGYKYISNNKYFPEYPITQDAAYLDDITKKYVRPLVPYGSILANSWTTEKDVSADNLVDFCAFNNLANLPLDENNEYMAGQQNAPAEQAETAIRQYFDVSVEYLRTSSRYNKADGYAMLNGGGGGMTRALHTEQSGDLLIVTVGLYGPDDEIPDRPVKTGLLTIRLDGESYQYLSYGLE